MLLPGVDCCCCFLQVLYYFHNKGYGLSDASVDNFMYGPTAGGGYGATMIDLGAAAPFDKLGEHKLQVVSACVCVTLSVTKHGACTIVPLQVLFVQSL